MKWDHMYFLEWRDRLTWRTSTWRSNVMPFDKKEEITIDGEKMDDDLTPMTKTKIRQQRNSNLRKNCYRRLIFDEIVSERGQVRELRTHAHLKNIAKFKGRTYRSDETFEWKVL